MTQTPFKRTLLLSTMAIGLLFSTSIATALEADDFSYYLIPPESSVTINDELVTNDFQEGKMRFRQAEKEILRVDTDLKGVRLFKKNLEVRTQSGAVISLDDRLLLEAGSIYVTDTGENAETKVLYAAELKISFESARFLAFVSGDGTEKIIKVLEGEVSVENPVTDQEALISENFATSADDEGKILIPSSFQIIEANRWWQSEAYEYDFQLLPIADAGLDQRVLGNIPVVLDGTDSEFKTGDVFVWKLIKAPPDEQGNEIDAVLFDSTKITKPIVTLETEGEYQFNLQISNERGGKSNIDTVSIFVGRQYLQPIAVFPDVSVDHPNNLAITYLYTKNVMRGSEDPETGQITFRPDDFVNRAEILKTVFENKRQDIPSQEELEALEDPIFLDVRIDHWFGPYVHLAKKLGIVKGNDGLYRPADTVILIEALKIIAESHQINIDPFRDVKKPYKDSVRGEWYNPYLAFAKFYNLIDRDAEGNVHPAKQLTRAELAEIIYRMSSVDLLEKRGFLLGEVKDEQSKDGIPGAKVFIYKALEEGSGDPESATFYKKGDLYYQTKTQSDGTFHISLPIQTKFYIEALSGDEVSKNRIITETEEDQETTIELEIEVKTE